MLEHIERMTSLMPVGMRHKIEPLLEALTILREVENPDERAGVFGLARR